MTSVQR